MSVPTEQLDRAIAAARVRESQGYFTKVKAGDQKAASLFVKLVACDLNPNGVTSDFGWLSKSPGETQVDGFAEDAICWTANPANLENVLDMINGAGAPNASLPSGLPDVKPRRENNKWVKPVPLSQADLDYLLQGAQPQPPAHKPYPGDDVWDAVGQVLFADYAAAGQAPNPLMGRWFGRVIWDATAGDESGKVWTVPDSIAKHRPEWRSALGLPPV